jgi:hypothetical protein
LSFNATYFTVNTSLIFNFITFLDLQLFYMAKYSTLPLSILDNISR